MLAKLHNFGPFQFFFTLSCADLRWNENFATIIRERGWTIRHSIEEDEDGYPSTSIYVDYEKNGKQHSERVQELLKSEVDDSIHECIRGNVLLATRFFNHRVKQFMNEIAMGGGNPISVYKYPYKVEFQDRGAGHVHGTLWVNLHTIDSMRVIQNAGSDTLSFQFGKQYW